MAFEYKVNEIVELQKMLFFTHLFHFIDAALIDSTNVLLKISLLILILKSTKIHHYRTKILLFVVRSLALFSRKARKKRNITVESENKKKESAQACLIFASIICFKKHSLMFLSMISTGISILICICNEPKLDFTFLSHPSNWKRKVSSSNKQYVFVLLLLFLAVFTLNFF